MNDHQVAAAVTVMLVLALALWLALRALRRAAEARGRHEVLDARLAECAQQLQRLDTALAASAAENARRHADIEQRLEKLVESQEQLRMLDEDGGSYSHAIQLARRGASAEELVRDCGVNRGEAEILISLHARAGQE